jgi:uncharacterized protein (TIGR02217 family)
MPNPFLEERITVYISYDSSWTDAFNVRITKTSGGAEYRSLVHPIPTRYFEISIDSTPEELYESIANLYWRCFGKYAGFRAKALDDYTTNNFVDAPTAFDQECALVSAGVYQLQKEYGSGGTEISIGLPIRTIYKPVSGTVLVGIVNTLTGNHQQTITTHWTVDTTTGRITFAANKTDAIESITLGATTTIGLTAHTYNVGDSVHFSSIVGTTELNGKRATVASKTTDSITVNIDSTAYTTYVSGGTVNTRPQSGETVKAGCEFDIPVRFDSNMNINQSDYGLRLIKSIELVELIEEP